MNARDMKVVHGLVANIASLCATLMDYLAASMPTESGQDANPETGPAGVDKRDVIDAIQRASDGVKGLPPMFGRREQPAGPPAAAPAPIPVDQPTGTVATGAKDVSATD